MQPRIDHAASYEFPTATELRQSITEKTQDLVDFADEDCVVVAGSIKIVSQLGYLEPRFSILRDGDGNDGTILAQGLRKLRDGDTSSSF